MEVTSWLEGWSLVGKLHNETELIIVLKMSEMDSLISCNAFRITTLAANKITLFN
jgi:hypothetical protein